MNLINSEWLGKKFGKLVIIKVLTNNKVFKSSKEKVLRVKCNCGNITIKQPLYLTNGQTKSCGKCSYIERNSFLGKRFKKLVIIDILNTKERIPPRSCKKNIKVRCDCGNVKIVSSHSLTSGKNTTCNNCKNQRNKSNRWWYTIEFNNFSVVLVKKDYVLCKCKTCNKIKKFEKNYTYINERKTCNKCGFITSKKLIGKVFGKLTVTAIKTKTFGYYTEISCTCACGNIIELPYFKLKNGLTDCKKCEYVKPEYFINKKFGSLKVISYLSKDKEFHKRTRKVKFKVKCKCGKSFKATPFFLTTSKTLNCQKCNWRNKDWWIGRKYGFLKVISIKSKLKEFSKYSLLDNLLCKCRCGGKVTVNANYLTNSYTTHCGKCIHQYKQFYHTFKNFNNHPSIQLNKNVKVGEFKCLLCSRIFHKSIKKAISYKTISCGCLGVTSNISTMNMEVFKFIKSLNVKVKLEYKLKDSRYHFDILCKDFKGSYLAIEMNGLYWHGDKTKINEIEKYKLALNKGYKYLMLYEDEWRYKQDVCKNLIKSSLGLVKAQSIRPRKCDIKYIKAERSKKFFNKFHIQGFTNSTYHIGVFYKNKLLACMSIGRPSRQNSGDWEIKRMASNFNYRVHGVWSWLIKNPIFKKKFRGKVVTFSDNRMFGGRVYQVMGMQKVKDLKRDYFYVKGRKRYHKSGLRKTKEEKLTSKTELELRTEQGYKRIWDLGKIKWEINF